MTRANPEQLRHLARIRDNLIEMRRCLRESEKARDTFYAIRDAYKEEKGLTRGDLSMTMKSDFDVQCAIEDSQLYDRWVTKYASVVSAEVDAFRANVHADTQSLDISDRWYPRGE